MSAHSQTVIVNVDDLRTLIAEKQPTSQSVPQLPESKSVIVQETDTLISGLNSVNNPWAFFLIALLIVCITIAATHFFKNAPKTKLFARNGSGEKVPVDKKHLPEETLNQIAMNREKIDDVEGDVKAVESKLNEHREDFKRFENQNREDHQRVVDRIDHLFMKKGK